MDPTDESTIDRDDRQATSVSADDGDHTGQNHISNNSNEKDQTELTVVDPSEPKLVSRVLVTWIELTVIGISGGLLGAAVGGPPGFIIYLATTLLTVGIIFHNVNQIVKEWVQATIKNE